jgi:hypothetical protein
MCFVFYFDTFDDQVFVICNKILFDVFVAISDSEEGYVHQSGVKLVSAGNGEFSFYTNLI